MWWMCSLHSRGCLALCRSAEQKHGKIRRGHLPPLLSWTAAHTVMQASARQPYHAVMLLLPPMLCHSVGPADYVFVLPMKRVCMCACVCPDPQPTGSTTSTESSTWRTAQLIETGTPLQKHYRVMPLADLVACCRLYVCVGVQLVPLCHCGRAAAPLGVHVADFASKETRNQTTATPLRSGHVLWVQCTIFTDCGPNLQPLCTLHFPPATPAKPYVLHGGLHLHGYTCVSILRQQH